MDAHKKFGMGILGCSAGILVCWLAYFFFHILKNIQRLPPAEQKAELLLILWHLPSVLPALLGFSLLKRAFLTRKFFQLYLASFGLFLCTYGWSLIAPGAISAGIPVILLLWPVNLLLLFAVLDEFRKRKLYRGNI